MGLLSYVYLASALIFNCNYNICIEHNLYRLIIKLSTNGIREKSSCLIYLDKF